MIVSARVFLILLIPLLVQGADSQQQHWMDAVLLGPLGEVTKPNTGRMPASQAPEPNIISSHPPLDDYILLEPISRDENIDYKEADRRNGACLLPLGTECHPYPCSGPTNAYQTIRSHSVGTTRQGDIVLIPYRTMVRISRSPIIRLSTNTRHVDLHEQARITAYCESEYDQRKKKYQKKYPNLGSQDRELDEPEEYVDRCFNKCLWRSKLDEFPKVPLKTHLKGNHGVGGGDARRV